MKQLGFYFDSNACSGCKTCQMACKDKNNLPLGIRWRRVYEVTGGSWEQKGESWIQDIAAYNISMACNHCENPVCLQSCPAKAIAKREDGIVEIDQTKCLGCRYCEWVCPFGAPQFNAVLGVMGKCNLCADYVDVGKNPSCVDACPMRALDFGEIEQLREKYGESATVFPLVEEKMTKPAHVFNAHDDAKDINKDFNVDNWEEVKNA